MALIRLRLCTGWSEPLLVAITTLLEISCVHEIAPELLFHIKVNIQIAETHENYKFLRETKFYCE